MQYNYYYLYTSTPPDTIQRATASAQLTYFASGVMTKTSNEGEELGGKDQASLRRKEITKQIQMSQSLHRCLTPSRS
jgi:hypothetical protein